MVDGVPIIKTVVIDGNNRTKRKFILAKSEIKTGAEYTEDIIQEAKKRLEATGLFIVVQIFPIVNRERVTILIVVAERRYFRFTNYSGSIYDRKYGQISKRRWIQAYGGFAIDNFRGLDERIEVDLSIWTIRYLGVSWYKPLINYPYFFRIGSKIGSQPYLNDSWNLDFYNISFATVGRKIRAHSKISLTIDGQYRKHTWKGGLGNFYRNDTLFNSGKSNYDSIPMGLNDTLIFNDSINTYRWVGLDSNKINIKEKPFTEAFVSLGWSTDRRDNRYYPHTGILFFTNLRTNVLWPYKDTSNNKQYYLRSNTDISLFHRGIWKSNTVAYRVRPSLTLFGEGNIYRGLYMGDIVSLRGFGYGQFGGADYNNRLLFSLEYRFPLFKMPDLKFQFLTWYDKGLAKLSTKFEGAFILDYGHLWKNIEKPLSENEITATGAGFGVRVVSPNIKRSVCFDIVWPLAPDTYRNFKNVAWYLYLDMPF